MRMWLTTTRFLATVVLIVHPLPFWGKGEVSLEFAL